MRREAGFTLVEVVIVMVIMALLITAGIVWAVPWLGREDARSAAYMIQSNLQLARIQAVNRNRSCRFVVDSQSGVLQVIDLNDPSTSTDDVVLEQATIPRTVSFADPSGGAAVTLVSMGGTRYEATFAADGSVTEGAGVINLAGGSRYERLTLFGAGGVRTEVWDGAAWNSGS